MKRILTAMLITISTVAAAHAKGGVSVAHVSVAHAAPAAHVATPAPAARATVSAKTTGAKTTGKSARKSTITPVIPHIIHRPDDEEQRKKKAKAKGLHGIQ